MDDQDDNLKPAALIVALFVGVLSWGALIALAAWVWGAW